MKDKRNVIAAGMFAVMLCLFAGFMNMDAKGQEDRAVFPEIRAEAAAGGEWEYRVLEDGTAEITGYTGKNPEIRIPETIDGKKVTGIGNEAFFEDVDVNPGKPYGTLKSVEIPAGITYIGERAFYECGSLESICIPASVTDIGMDALGLCASLNQITVEEGNVVYDSRDNCNAIIKTAANMLIVGSSNTRIPESVTEIGDGAFAYRDLTDIEIPSGVEFIGTGAFAGCSKLKNITIPSGVTVIGKSAFGFCTGLTTVNILPGVTVIYAYAFDNCRALSSITIPESVTEIGNCAFRECNSLTGITIPASVTAIDTLAFLCCKKINRITVEEGNTVYDSRKDCNAIIETATDTLMMGCGSTVIPKGVKKIGHGAFYSCRKLNSIVIPSGVKEVDNLAFSGCVKLKKVTIKSKDLKSVGEGAFQGIAKKAVIKVPKDRADAYKKLFTEKTGYEKTMKIK